MAKVPNMHARNWIWAVAAALAAAPVHAQPGATPSGGLRPPTGAFDADGAGRAASGCVRVPSGTEPWGAPPSGVCGCACATRTTAAAPKAQARRGKDVIGAPQNSGSGSAARSRCVSDGSFTGT